MMLSAATLRNLEILNNQVKVQESTFATCQTGDSD